MAALEAPVASTSTSRSKLAPGAFISLGPDLDDGADEPVFKSRKGKGKEKDQAFKPPNVTVVKPLKPVSGPVLPVLPAKTLDWAQQVISPEDELFYQSAEASGVVANALQRSRAAWVNGGVLQKFSSSGKSKKTTPVWQPPHNLSALGKFTVEIGPHIFEETKMWEVKWAAAQQQSSAQPAPAKAAPKPAQSPPPSFSTKAASPAIIAQLSKMAASDPALSNTLRLAASGHASQAELQSLQMYVAKLEQQNAALDAPLSVATPLTTPQSPTSPVAGSSKSPSSPVAAKSAPSPANGQPTIASLQAATIGKSYGQTGYYPGMPRPPQPAQKMAYMPGVPQMKTSVLSSPPKAAVPAASSAKPARPPSIIIEFRDNPGERWILPDLFLIEEVSSPPNGEALVSFFVQPGTGVDSKGRPKLPLPAVRCQLQLKELNQHSFDSLMTVAKTVPLGKRVSAWKAFEAERAELPNVYIQFRLPHPTGSAGHQIAVEAHKAAWELKRKAGPTSAPLSGVSAGAPIAKKPKKPKKIKVMSALKAPKGTKGGQTGSVTPKEETPMLADDPSVESVTPMEGVEVAQETTV